MACTRNNEHYQEGVRFESKGTYRSSSLFEHRSRSGGRALVVFCTVADSVPDSKTD